MLNSALDIEHRSAAAYAAGAALLNGGLRAAAEQFAEHERAHAEALTEAISDLGGTANPPKAAAAYGFPQLATGEDALSFALTVENDAIAAYIDALPKLSSPDLRGTAASIVATEAEQPRSCSARWASHRSPMRSWSGGERERRPPGASRGLAT